MAQGDKLLTKQELANRWQVTVRSIDNWMKEGIIQQAKGVPVVRFTEQHILELEGVKIDKMSPLERKRLEYEIEKRDKKIENLEKENEKLKGIINKILVESSQIINMEAS